MKVIDVPMDHITMHTGDPKDNNNREKSIWVHMILRKKRKLARSI